MRGKFKLRHYRRLGKRNGDTLRLERERVQEQGAGADHTQDQSE
jgi:hypothetical protein